MRNRRGDLRGGKVHGEALVGVRLGRDALDSAEAVPPRADPEGEERAREIALAGIPENTRRAYDADWRLFTGWCQEHGASPLPAHPKTLEQFVTDRATKAWPKGRGRKAAPDTPGTIERRISSIAAFHRAAGFELPRGRGLALVLKGIRRRSRRKAHQAEPLTPDDLRKYCALPTSGTRELRDRALLLVGFAACLRREEIVQIDREHLEFKERNLLIWIPRSKTDADAKGERVVVSPGGDAATCPVRAMRALLEALPGDGPIFRRVSKGGRFGPGRLTTGEVSTVVKRAVARLGQNPHRYSGHSLRRGAASAAFRAGIGIPELMKLGRWRTAETALKYVEAIEQESLGMTEKLGL